ncbi:hypothetical protein SO802_007930 [Lithocarpus litseifolius]|uniref:Cytochrome P450 n=1 Tax=Lithocarpus litseifolius TaxID=425828 RepID=A0AAW2DQE7_9ROSI
MGLPLIGETFQLLEAGYSLDMIPFMKKRIQIYGLIFKTSVAGRPLIVSADPNFNHYIFQQDGKAGAGINVAHTHKYVRSMALNHFGVNALKDKLLLQMEEMVSVALDNWSCQASIDVKYVSATMALKFGAKQLINYDPPQSSGNITDFYFSLLRTLMSFPLNIPSTAYHKCMKNREKALNMIRKVFKQRLASPEKRSPGDFLDSVICDMKVEDFPTAEFVVQMIFGLLFAMSDTISIMTKLTLKLLDDYPHVLEQLIVEHEAILKKREKPDSSLLRNEYKSMAYTLQVVNEVLRSGNFAPGMFRRTLRDVQVNGNF